MPRLSPDWKGYDETCINFLTSQKKGTQNTYKAFLKHILKFTGMTGQEILASKREDKNYEWEKKVIEFKQWMKNQKTPQGKNYSDNAVNTAVNTLRSFFDYYRTKLDFSQNENRKLNGKAQRVTKDYMLTNPDISKMTFVGNLKEKYIVLLGKSIGLRASDFTILTYGNFRSINLEQEPPIFMGELQTEKEGAKAYPFIDSDALPIIKTILDVNKNKPNTERIITTQEEELSTIIQNLAKKANINTGDKHLRFHCFRKYLSDRLSANMSESKWKQIVGKTIPEEAYVSNFELRELYLKTMNLTTINTNGNGKVTKLSEELSQLTNKINTKDEIIDTLATNSKEKDLKIKKLESEDKELREQLNKIQERLEMLEQFAGKIDAQIEASTSKERRTILILKPEAIKKLEKEHPEWMMTNEENETFLTLQSETIAELEKEHPEWMMTNGKTEQELRELMIKIRNTFWERINQKYQQNNQASKTETTKPT